MPLALAEIKDFNELIDKNYFLINQKKSKEEACEKVVEMSRNNDDTRGNLLDYSYH